MEQAPFAWPPGSHAERIRIVARLGVATCSCNDLAYSLTNMLYPIVESDSFVSISELLGRVEAIFTLFEMSPQDAHLLADSLVAADARGVHSHGVLRVPDYAKKLLKDGVNPRGRPHVIREFGAIALLDGDNAMGQIACAAAMKDAISRAAQF